MLHGLLAIGILRPDSNAYQFGTAGNWVLLYITSQTVYREGAIPWELASLVVAH